MTQEDEKVLQSLKDNAIKSFEAFDRTMVLISSGGLVLSMTFIEKLADGAAKCPGLLIVSWFFLAITLFFCLVSHLISANNFFNTAEAHIRLIQVKKKTVVKAKDIIGIHDQINTSNAWIEALTYWAFVFLFLGCFMLISFASVNILAPKATGNEKGQSNVETIIY